MTFKTNDTVSFKAGPKSTTITEATVVGEYNNGRGTFLMTKDAAGVERNVRPGNCTLVETKKAA